MKIKAKFTWNSAKIYSRICSKKFFEMYFCSEILEVKIIIMLPPMLFWDALTKVGKSEQIGGHKNSIMFSQNMRTIKNFCSETLEIVEIYRKGFIKMNFFGKPKRMLFVQTSNSIRDIFPERIQVIFHQIFGLTFCHETLSPFFFCLFSCRSRYVFHERSFLS